ncbi:hypothetical protein TcWFU_003209 [Taenia crassiceps]|uniref:Uncharacterized protein n=1 Tax=Taenia crassiceps TaxID=6207 RepID=A0ABR4Q1T7_9CEST
MCARRHEGATDGGSVARGRWVSGLCTQHGEMQLPDTLHHFDSTACKTYLSAYLPRHGCFLAHRSAPVQTTESIASSPLTTCHRPVSHHAHRRRLPCLQALTHSYYRTYNTHTRMSQSLRLLIPTVALHQAHYCARKHEVLLHNTESMQ